MAARIPGTIFSFLRSDVKTELEQTAATDAATKLSDRTGESTALGCAPNKDAELPKQQEAACIEMRDVKLNSTVSTYQADLADWTLGHVSLNSLATQLHDWAAELWAEFVPMLWKGRAISRPAFFIVFDWEPSRILGHYHPGRNQAGIRWEISVNPANLSRLSQIEVASILLHEEFHAFEDITGTAPRSRNGYHSSWLRRVAGEVGIPCTRFGCTCGIRPDSAFMTWAKRRALQGTPILNIIAEPVQPTKQKRQPWICECPKDRAVTVYVPTGSKLVARCEACTALFRIKGIPEEATAASQIPGISQAITKANENSIFTK